MDSHNRSDFVFLSGAIGLLTAFALFACSSSPATQTQAVGGYTSNCGQPCVCADGLSGTVDCTTYNCSCATCADVTSKPVTSPTCGGDPFGTWKAVSLDASGIRMRAFSYSDSDKHVVPTRDCGAELVQAAAIGDLEFRIQFVSGGSGSVTSEGPVAVLSANKSCAAGRYVADCSTQTGCTAAADCVCQCTENIEPLDEGFTWTRSGSTLSLSMRASEARTYDYCVQGDTMQLFDSRSGVLYTMERLTALGSPLDCQSRTSDVCTKGTGCNSGACVGVSACASAAYEANCTNISGCTWNAQGCNGKAQATCNFDDYGVVPGCIYLAPGQTASCAGQAIACSALSNGVCGYQPGCAVGTACQGDKTLGNTHTCYSSDVGKIAGCSCDAYLRCTTYTCASLTPTECAYAVSSGNYCASVDTGCGGAATTCVNRTVENCSGYGCYLQVKAN